MDYFVVAHPWLLYVLLALVAGLLFLRIKMHKTVRYRYSLADSIAKHGLGTKSLFPLFFLCLRVCVLALLALVVARPQLVDVDSPLPVEGIDIILVLDVSGSMQYFDDLQDRRMRLDVAKQEAINFIERRENDPIGLVIFAKNAVSRCPLTLDKKMLKEIVSDLQLGVIDPNGTVLCTGIAMAANRLKSSKAKSKIMIVLTDGSPSTPDVDCNDAIAVAKKLGIKIYTVGIGNDEGGYMAHPYFGIQRVEFSLNKELLNTLATQTGGRFFEAKKPQDMKTIYQIIDSLEKTEYETTLYINYYDIFKPFLVAVIILLLLELLLSTFVWFKL